MENENIRFVEYPNWPEWMKALSALYWKPGFKPFINNPETIKNLSFFNLSAGIFVVLEVWFLSDTEVPFLKTFNYYLLVGGILNLLLGCLNLFYNYKMHRWVKDNSSWKERFGHKSSGKHQLQYLLMWVVIIAASFGIACLLYC